MSRSKATHVVEDKQAQNPKPQVPMWTGPSWRTIFLRRACNPDTATSAIMKATSATTVEVTEDATAAAIELTVDTEARRDDPAVIYPCDRLCVHVEKAITAFKASTS